MQESVGCRVGWRTDYLITDQLNSDLKHRAVKGASVVFAVQAFGFLVTTVGHIILARLLTPADFGLVAMVLPLALLLLNVGADGFTDSIIQSEEIRHVQISTLFWINVGLSVTLSAVFITAAPLIASFYREPQLTSITIGLACMIVAGGLSTQHRALLKRSLQFHKTAFCEAAALISGTLVAVVLAWCGWGPWALVARWVTVSLVVAIGSWFVCKWRPGWPRAITEVRPMLRYSINLQITSIITNIRRSVDKILIGRYEGIEALGLYERAFNFAGLLPAQVFDPLSNVSLAVFSRLRKNPSEYRRAYLNLVEILCFCCMPLAALLSVVGKDLVILLLGPQWHEAGVIFSVLSLSTGVAIVYLTHAWHHLALGTTGRFWRWNLCSSLVCMMLLLAGLKLGGAVGVAAAYSCSFFLLVGPALEYAGRPVQLTWRSVLAVIWKYCVAAFIAGVICYALVSQKGSAILSDPKWHPFLKIVVTSVIFTTLYLALVVLLFRSVYPLLKPVSLFKTIIADRLNKNQSLVGSRHRRCKRVVLFGHFGAGNLGNDCTLQAVIASVKAFLPNVNIDCVCTAPDKTAGYFGIRTFPMAKVQSKLPRAQTRTDTFRLARRMLGGLREALHMYRSFRFLRTADVLIMTGTGMLSDRLTRMHFEILKWTVIAKLSHCRVAFLSVGAESIDTWLGRVIIKSALKLADYRSYRDEHSQKLLQTIGFSGDKDPVYPDLAFSLPDTMFAISQKSDSGSTEPVIGIGLMGYRRELSRPENGAYQRYLEKMGRLVGWLLERGYRIHFLIGDTVYDSGVADEVKAILREQGLIVKDSQLIDTHISSIDDLTTAIAATDVVVATRYHNVVLAIMLDKPVISIGYEKKNDALMSEVGLGEYCHYIEDFELDVVVSQVERMAKYAKKSQHRFRHTCARFRGALADQYRIVLNTL